MARQRAWGSFVLLTLMLVSAPIKSADDNVQSKIPDAVKQAVKSCVLVRTDKGDGMGILLSEDTVCVGLSVVNESSELAVVLPKEHPADGEIYDVHVEALIAYVDTDTNIAILELLKPIKDQPGLKFHEKKEMPTQAWALVRRDKANKPNEVEPLSCKLLGESEKLYAIIPGTLGEQGVLLVDDNGNLLAAVQNGGGVPARPLKKIPLRKDLIKPVHRYRSQQPRLLPLGDQNAQKLQAKLSKVAEVIEPLRTQGKLKECIPLIENELTKRTNARVAPTLKIWIEKITQANEFSSYLQDQLNNQTGLVLVLDNIKLKTDGTQDGELILKTTVAIDKLDSDQIRSLMRQTPKWKDKDATQLEEVIANFSQVTTPDSSFFQTVQQAGLPAGNPFVEVNDPAWETYLGNPQHNPYFRGTVTGEAEKKWSVAVQPGSRLAADLRAIYYFQGGRHRAMTLHKLSLATGKILKSKTFGTTARANPPGLSSKYLFFQHANHSKTQLVCLDKNSFEQVWSSPCPEQWSTHEAPTIYKDNVFVNGGTYGGWYGFDLSSGKQLWFGKLPFYDGWTPCLYKDRAYAVAGGTIFAVDPTTGKELWNKKLSQSDRSSGTVVAAQGRIFVTSRSKGLQVVNTENQNLEWSKTGSFYAPVVGNGLVFTASQSGVIAYTLKGDEKWRWRPSTRVSRSSFSGSPILFGNMLIVSSGEKTYFLEAKTGKLLNSIAAGGDLAVVGRRLLIRASSSLSCFELK